MPTSTQETRREAVAVAEPGSLYDTILSPAALRAICMRPAYLESSAWSEHIPFAFWLIECHRPRLFVELGTQGGTSYFAFCQAVERLRVDARCFAIETRRGDEETGLYGPEAFEKVEEYNDSQYSGFSQLVRSTFDDALREFSDGTIDLLHIEGLHMAQGVRHDFEAWLPKLSKRGVVVLHDTNARERGPGVFKLFEELRERYPSFEFVHGRGLGVLGIGEQQNEPVRSLFQAQRDKSSRRILHELFGGLGRACADDFAAQRQQAEARLMEEGLRKSEHEKQSQISELKAIRDRLQLDNSKLTRNIQIRFDELAKLTRMLFETEELANTLEARITSTMGEVARLDRRIEAMSLPDRREPVEPASAAIREYEIRTLAGRPQLMEWSVEGRREAQIELTVFGEARRRIKAARLTVEAFGSNGDRRGRVRWGSYTGQGASRLAAFLRGCSLRWQGKGQGTASATVSASLEGEVFSARVKLPAGGTSRLRMTCERLAGNSKLLLVRGNTTIFDQPVLPNQDLTLKFGVVSERSLRRALRLVPQYFDKAGKLLPPPYQGFRSDEAHPAFAYVSGASRTRLTILQLRTPSHAARLRLQVRPALARGRVSITEAESLEPIFSFTREPRRDAVKVSLTLSAPSRDSHAAILLPRYFDSDGARIPETAHHTAQPGASPPLRFLPAGPSGVKSTLTVAVPGGTRKCRIDVVPCTTSAGLRVEAGRVAKEAAQLSGVLLPAEGRVLECSVDSNAILCFKLRVTGARDLNPAGRCVITYLDPAGETIPPPYPGLHEEDGGVLFFGASSRAQGLVEVVRLPCPPGAARARLRFVPITVRDALRIRIEPMGNRPSMVKADT